MRARFFILNRLGVAMAALAAQAIVVSVAAGQPTLERELGSALASMPHAETRVSACVIDLRSGETVFERQPNQPLTPASSMKLFTMATGLDVLGADFQFETVLVTDGTNLIVIGDGDPSAGDEKLLLASGESIGAEFERWAAVFVDRDVTTIPGGLFVDESIFDRQRVHPSWEEADLDNWYAAPVGALNYNDNCIDITIEPSAQTGAPVLVSFVPENGLVEVANTCRSGGKGKPVLRHRHDSFSYLISGHCRKRWPFGPVSFPDPGMLFADSMRTVFNKQGLAIEGAIDRKRVRLANGAVPKDHAIVATTTNALATTLSRIGKNSQNLFAECLFKRAGYEWAQKTGQADPVGSWQTGREAVLSVVRRAQVPTPGLTVADGSGLSRDNACSARQLVLMLTWIHEQPFGVMLRNNLAIGGGNGSLRKRLTELGDRVQAKTGTMRGVTALAGYVGGEGEVRYAFAVLFNGFPGTSAPYKAIQDEFCRALARTTSNGSATAAHGPTKSSNSRP